MTTFHPEASNVMLELLPRLEEWKKNGMIVYLLLLCLYYILLLRWLSRSCAISAGWSTAGDCKYGWNCRLSRSVTRRGEETIISSITHSCPPWIPNQYTIYWCWWNSHSGSSYHTLSLFFVNSSICRWKPFVYMRIIIQRFNSFSRWKQCHCLTIRYLYGYF